MITKVENIDQFNRYFNQPTYHPLVSVANLADAHLSLFNPTDFGMYCVVLMDTEFGELILRDSDMNYQSGTIFTMKPGHVVSMNLSSGARPRGWMLAFRPELIVNTGLGRDFYMFNFFDYEVVEALKLYEANAASYSTASTTYSLNCVRQTMSLQAIWCASASDSCSVTAAASTTASSTRKRCAPQNLCSS